MHQAIPNHPLAALLLAQGYAKTTLQKQRRKEGGEKSSPVQRQAAPAIQM